MASRYRKIDKQKHGWKFSFPEGINTEICYYCGEPSTTEDHVPPLSKCDFYPDIDDYNIVPCCRDCNCRLGNLTHFNLDDRKICLKNLLIVKFKDLLEMPDWSKSDIDELGPTMKRYIKREIKRKEVAIRRIVF